MSNSVLYPPNLDNFSDDIIGQVMLRLTPSSYTYSSLNVAKEDPRMQSTMSAKSASCGAFHSTFSKRKRVQDSAPTSQPTKEKQKRVVSIDVRRERRRVNMQRYRHNLRDREGILEQKVQRLKEEIPGLQLQRDTVQARGKESTMWNIAAEYFRLFRHGLKENQWTMESSKGASLARSQAQKGFLYAVLDPDVVGLSGLGVEKLLDDYRTLAFCLPSMSTRLIRLTTARGSIHALTKVEIVITENTLRLALPHLVVRDNVSSLASKLLGQRFVMRGSTHFEWDSETDRISLLQSKAGLLTPMMELLGDVDMISSVFENALITPECTPTRGDQ